MRRMIGSTVLVAALAVGLVGCGTDDPVLPAAPPATTVPSVDGVVDTVGTADSTSSTSSVAPTTAAATPPTTEPPPSPPSTPVPAQTSAVGELPGSPQEVRLRFESRVGDVTSDSFRAEAMAILGDQRGWGRAGFTFVADDAAAYRVVLAEGPEVDALCLPLETGGRVSCQNGPVVALNADRWRRAVEHWDSDVATYRGYLVNHEVGHLLGQRHPVPRCPIAGRPAGVMEQQTGSLRGCVGNPWPRDWELDYARRRPVVYAPLPDWGPDPVPANLES